MPLNCTLVIVRGTLYVTHTLPLLEGKTVSSALKKSRWSDGLREYGRA